MPKKAAAMAAGTALPDMAPQIELTPHDRPAHGMRNAVLTMLFSLAVIAVVMHEAGGLDAARLMMMVPANPVFWLVFIASYLVTPASEWMIFHRLWNIPSSGFVALLRKKVYNELLLGYLGEAYFYTWARRKVSFTAAPFGAVKDVAILSAMAGNAVTLLLVASVLPLARNIATAFDQRMLLISLGVILIITLAATVLRRRVFTLARPDLMMIARWHILRIAVSAVLSAILWHLVLPAVPLMWWLYLAALRLLVSRLPLMPNKDLLFAGVAILVVGPEQDIGALMTMMAGLILMIHLVLGSAIAANDLANPEKRS